MVGLAAQTSPLCVAVRKAGRLGLRRESVNAWLKCHSMVRDSRRLHAARPGGGPGHTRARSERRRASVEQSKFTVPGGRHGQQTIDPPTHRRGGDRGHRARPDGDEHPGGTDQDPPAQAHRRAGSRRLRRCLDLERRHRSSPARRVSGHRARQPAARHRIGRHVPGERRQDDPRPGRARGPLLRRRRHRPGRGRPAQREVARVRRRVRARCRRAGRLDRPALPEQRPRQRAVRRARTRCPAGRPARTCTSSRAASTP